MTKKLTPEQEMVMKHKGTELPFTGKYWKKSADGKYRCASCGTVLFDSDDQFVSKEIGLQGWPSFSKAKNVELREDKSLFMKRTEVVCKKCKSHLGHVFDANDSPNGKHFCINSCALELEKKT